MKSLKGIFLGLGLILSGFNANGVMVDQEHVAFENPVLETPIAEALSIELPEVVSETVTDSWLTKNIVNPLQSGYKSVADSVVKCADDYAKSVKNGVKSGYKYVADSRVVKRAGDYAKSIKDGISTGWNDYVVPTGKGSVDFCAGKLTFVGNKTADLFGKVGLEKAELWTKEHPKTIAGIEAGVATAAVAGFVYGSVKLYQWLYENAKKKTEKKASYVQNSISSTDWH